MKKEYQKDTASVWASFEAGGACDDYGRPMPFWRCRVVYIWCACEHAYLVYTTQTVGFGIAEERVTHEAEMASLREVKHYLRYLSDIEECYQAVYGE